MSVPNRRELLKGLVGMLAAGTAVFASSGGAATASTVVNQEKKEDRSKRDELLKRAETLSGDQAEEGGCQQEDGEVHCAWPFVRGGGVFGKFPFAKGFGKAPTVFGKGPTFIKGPSWHKRAFA